MKNLILEMEEYAKEKNVPIMEKDGIAFLMKFIKANNIKNVLEIGSAIGYSAILMASSNPDVKVTTIEKDEVKVKALAHSLRKSAQKLCLGEIESLARKMEESPADKYHSFIEPLEKELTLYSKALEEE